MNVIQVKASKPYDVCIENGLLDRVGELSAPLLPGRTAALITEETVNSLYGDRAVGALERAGFTVHRLVLPAGEETKCLTRFGEVLEFLASRRLTRTDAVFALGGGVIGDLAGFAAAVYLRGVRYVQIPTTLLAAVDSSVGGKTAIDLSVGKNLAGAFHQPAAVFCDPTLLSTLPPETFSDGCAEVIKYAVLAGEPLYSLLQTPASADWETIITECVSVKRNLVEADEFDTGERMLLNLGHTFGHAIEQASALSVTHGKGVAIGTVAAARLSAHLGLCDPQLPEQIAGLLARYGLPVESPYPAAELEGHMLSDKKRAGKTIRLVLPEGFGRCILRETPIDELPALLREAFPGA
ncbi:MAG: 3-dehydroquinate synthase [Oscillospiraceae bacterium]|nr:3-dehydroquinate synthase [Oscillospiraceae bacterium]